ncbi:UDP-N-acetylmuramate--L-alanine ligase [Rhodococcus sp. X156]|uniref:UDP-N-acetylmuramate--L-alanine ligase n=1 Tax=Rhodococcus sp. X156 TaxID=2499145 RepID=UPI000FDA1C18|nr:UDP-N-acetylmuramate--L-alanine ligase [Rhodococcus sp. X156]
MTPLDEPNELSEGLPAELARVHMVGIGGAGMSGVARILLARGGQVSGSDAKESRGVLALRARGAQVRLGHDPSALDLLPGGPTTVVTTTAAIPKDNPELVEARRRGIPVTVRPKVLASLMTETRNVLVAGTHGKTSTTSMLVVALQRCAFDPSFAIGGELNESGTNAHHGSGDVFVAEADESDGSLLEYSPHVVVVTNVDYDHLDYFGTVEAYVAVFDAFLERIDPDGVLIACADDPGSAALADRAEAAGLRVQRYGRAEGADARLLSWSAADGGGAGEVALAGESAARPMRLNVPGEHMALNALGALLAALAVGADPARALEGLTSFGGVHRRFQLTGSEAGVRVYDDYAHHPTEVQAVLRAARAVVEQQPDGPGRVVVLFQPHLYSRTLTFATEFGAALSLADEVVVLDVYAAREEPVAGVSGAIVAEAVTCPVNYQPHLAAAPEQVAALTRPGDLVLTMGAGDVTMLGPEILRSLRLRAGGSLP